MKPKQHADYTASSATISARMSKVKSKDTQPEMLVRRFLHQAGFRYRLHTISLPGSPDIVLAKYRTVVFIHGCFWHQHNIGCGKRITPNENVAYWVPKLKRTVQRDLANRLALEKAGWKVLVVWECELKRAVRGATLHQLSANILGDEWKWEATYQGFE